jgi:hypothetical protein
MRKNNSMGKNDIEGFLTTRERRALDVLRSDSMNRPDSGPDQSTAVDEGVSVVRNSLFKFLSRDVRDVLKSAKEEEQSRNTRLIEGWMEELTRPENALTAHDSEHRKLVLVVDISSQMRINPALICPSLLVAMIAVFREYLNFWNPGWTSHEQMKSFYMVAARLSDKDGDFSDLNLNELVRDIGKQAKSLVVGSCEELFSPTVLAHKHTSCVSASMRQEDPAWRPALQGNRRLLN